MSNGKSQDLFQIIRLGITLDDVSDNVLSEHINDSNEYGRNLLQEAIAHRQEAYALFLINKGINVNHRDENGATPLHYAAVYKLPLIAESILKHNGDPNLFDKHGNGPLWTAVFNARGEYKIVELLRDFNAEVNSKNLYGKSPLDFADQIKDNILINLLTKKN